MSNPGLGAHLELQIDAALRRVDQVAQAITQATEGVPVTLDTGNVPREIQAAVDAADTNVTVTADTAELPREIQTAVDAADPQVPVTADTSTIPGEIQGAIDSADTQATVTADASAVTGSITAAVGAADTSVTVTADTGEAQTEVRSLADRLAQLEGKDRTILIKADASAAQRTIANIDRQLQNPNLNDHEIRVLVDQRNEASRRLEALQSQLGNVAEATAAVAGEAVEAGVELGRLRTVLTGLSAAAVLAGLYNATQAASDLAESSSKARVVFGDNFQQIASFAENAATSVGLSNQAALEAAATFGNLFQALGVGAGDASNLSTQVVQLAGDLASFNNLGVDETLEKIRSGLVGEIEPLRSLGISFNQANVEAKALQLGLAATVDELTEGDKVLARFALITEQTAFAQGDFARTSAGLANQQRILRAEIDNTVAAAGQALLPAMLDLVQVARGDLVPSLGQLAEDVLPSLAGIVSDLAPLLGTTVDLLVAAGPVLRVVATVVDAIPAPLLAMAGGLLAVNRVLPVSSGGVERLALNLAAMASKGLPPIHPLAIAAAAGLAILADRSADAAREKAELADAVAVATRALRDEDGQLDVSTAKLRDFITAGTEEANGSAKFLERLGFSVQELTGFLDAGQAGTEAFNDAVNSGGLAADIARRRYGALTGALEDMIRQQLIAAVNSGAITQAQADEVLASDNLLAAFRALNGEIVAHTDAQNAALQRYGPLISQAQALGTAYTTLQGENAGS